MSHKVRVELFPGLTLTGHPHWLMILLFGGGHQFVGSAEANIAEAPRQMVEVVHGLQRPSVACTTLSFTTTARGGIKRRLRSSRC